MCNNGAEIVGSKAVVNLLPPSVRVMSSFLERYCHYKIPSRTPSAGRSIHWGGENCDSDRNRRLCHKCYEIGSTQNVSGVCPSRRLYGLTWN